ncbi:ERC protein 2-like isoform X2 [Gordionus sp. m RMFG-2023]|uniref:ERC protein 2-like isoform X2 n=1 Tax=Gordionus sp. m RMFG-2023 TaxID=3053472 RepID=UPI0031FBD54D
MNTNENEIVTRIDNSNSINLFKPISHQECYKNGESLPHYTQRKRTQSAMSLRSLPEDYFEDYFSIKPSPLLPPSFSQHLSQQQEFTTTQNIENPFSRVDDRGDEEELVFHEDYYPCFMKYPVTKNNFLNRGANQYPYYDHHHHNKDMLNNKYKPRCMSQLALSEILVEKPPASWDDYNFDEDENIENEGFDLINLNLVNYEPHLAYAADPETPTLIDYNDYNDYVREISNDMTAPARVLTSKTEINRTFSDYSCKTIPVLVSKPIKRFIVNGFDNPSQSSDWNPLNYHFNGKKIPHHHHHHQHHQNLNHYGNIKIENIKAKGSGPKYKSPLFNSSSMESGSLNHPCSNNPKYRNYVADDKSHFLLSNTDDTKNDDYIYAPNDVNLDNIEYRGRSDKSRQSNPFLENFSSEIKSHIGEEDRNKDEEVKENLAQLRPSGDNKDKDSNSIVAGLNIKINLLCKEKTALKMELESVVKRFNSSVNSIKHFWSPELKREREMRREETRRHDMNTEKFKLISSENRKLEIALEILRKEMESEECRFKDILRIGKNVTHQETAADETPQPLALIGINDFETLLDHRNSLESQMETLQEKYNLLELQAETHIKTLHSRDETIKNLYETLSSYSEFEGESHEVKLKKKNIMKDFIVAEGMDRQILKSKLISTESKLEYCENILSKKNAEIERYKEAKKTGKPNPSDRLDNSSNLSSKITLLKSILEAKDARIASLELERNFLDKEARLESKTLRTNGHIRSQDYNISDKSIDSKAEDDANLRKKADILQADLNKTLTELCGYKAKYETLEKQIEDYKRHISFLKENISAKDAHAGMLKTDVDALRTRIDEFNTVLDKNKMDIKGIVQEKYNLSQQLTQTLENLELKDQTLQIYQHKTKSLEDLIKEKDLQLKTVLNKFYEFKKKVQRSSSVDTDRILTTPASHPTDFKLAEFVPIPKSSVHTILSQTQVEQLNKNNPIVVTSSSKAASPLCDEKRGALFSYNTTVNSRFIKKSPSMTDIAKTLNDDENPGSQISSMSSSPNKDNQKDSLLYNQSKDSGTQSDYEDKMLEKDQELAEKIANTSKLELDILNLKNDMEEGQAKSKKLIANYKSIIDEKEKLIQSLKQEMDKMGDKNDTVHSLEGELKALQKVLNETQKDFLEKEKSLQATTNRIKVYDDEKAKLKGSYEKMSIDISSLKNQLKGLQEKVKNQEAQIDKYVEEGSQLRKELQRSNQQNANLEFDNRKKWIDLENEIKSKNQEISQKEREVDRLTKVLKLMERDKLAIESELGTFKERFCLDNSQNDQDDLRGKVLDLTEQLKEKEETLNELTNKLLECNEEIQAQKLILEAEKKEYECIVRSMQDENNDLKKNIKQIEGKSLKNMTKMKEMEEELRRAQQITSETQEAVEIKSNKEMETADAKIADLREKNDQLERMTDQQTAKINEIFLKYKEKDTNLKSLIAERNKIMHELIDSKKEVYKSGISEKDAMIALLGTTMGPKTEEQINALRKEKELLVHKLKSSEETRN